MDVHLEPTDRTALALAAPTPLEGGLVEFHGPGTEVGAVDRRRTVGTTTAAGTLGAGTTLLTARSGSTALGGALLAALTALTALTALAALAALAAATAPSATTATPGA